MMSDYLAKLLGKNLEYFNIQHWPKTSFVKFSLSINFFKNLYLATVICGKSKSFCISEYQYHHDELHCRTSCNILHVDQRHVFKFSLFNVLNTFFENHQTLKNKPGSEMHFALYDSLLCQFECIGNRSINQVSSQ